VNQDFSNKLDVKDRDNIGRVDRNAGETILERLTAEVIFFTMVALRYENNRQLVVSSQLERIAPHVMRGRNFARECDGNMPILLQLAGNSCPCCYL